MRYLIVVALALISFIWYYNQPEAFKKDESLPPALQLGKDKDMEISPHAPLEDVKK